MTQQQWQADVLAKIDAARAAAASPIPPPAVVTPIPPIPIPPVTPTPPTGNHTGGLFVQTVGERLSAPTGAPVVRWMLNLRAYINRPLPQSVLSGLWTDLSGARPRKQAIIVRPVYNFTHDEVFVPDQYGANVDATFAIARGHVVQLATVFNYFPDVITVIESGQQGRWGEQNYSNVAAATVRNYDEWWQNPLRPERRQLYKAQFDLYTLPVALRYVEDVKAMKLILTPAQWRRLCMWVDSMCADGSEGGTWHGVTPSGQIGMVSENVAWITANHPPGWYYEGETENSMNISDAELIGLVDRAVTLGLRALHSDYRPETIARLKALLHPSGVSCWDYLVRSMAALP